MGEEGDQSTLKVQKSKQGCYENINRILVLRSVDLKLTCESLDLLSKRFPKAEISLLIHNSAMDFFLKERPDVHLIGYPFGNFTVAAPKQAIKNIPAMDLAVSLHRNDGDSYKSVDIFLSSHIRSRYYGFIKNGNHLEIQGRSCVLKLYDLIKENWLLYGYSPLSAMKSMFLNRKYAGQCNRILLLRGASLVVDKGASFSIAPNSVVRVGFTPLDEINQQEKTVVRVQRNGSLECRGSVTLFRGVGVNVYPGSQLSIGDGSFIGHNSKICLEKKIELGRNCAVAWGVEIMDSDFHRIRTDEEPSLSGVVINDNVWIGAGARILKNVTLGRNVVVGADSVVTKSFPANSIIVGNPARRIGTKKEPYRV